MNQLIFTYRYHSNFRKMLAIALFVQGVVVLTPALAHEGDSPFHYVAETGKDTGPCDRAEYPCRSLEYVMTHAEKGDTVLVASGTYSYQPEDPQEIVTILSPIVQVRGGYTVDDGFKTQDMNSNPTIVSEVVPDYVDKLNTRGFITVAQANTDVTRDANAGLLANIGTPRYVVDEGLDSGACSSTETACNLSHALEVAESGDSVLIASGSYVIPPELAEQLMRPDITVVGGVVENAGFARAASAEQSAPSYITGPSFDQRENLAQRGLTLIQDKKGLFIQESRARLQRSGAAAEQLSFSPCDSVTGLAAGVFPCKNVDLLSNIPLNRFSTSPQAANDIWGFTDQKDGKEYAIIGLLNGTAVVDVSTPENPVEIGTIPGRDAQWRDIKVYQFKNNDGKWQAYAYVTADNPVGGSQGLQIINLSTLPASISLAATWNEIRRAHNVYISNVDYETGIAIDGMEPFVYIAGSNKNSGAALALELSNPTAPTEVLVASSDTQYIHDGTSFVLTDSRTEHCKSGGSPPASGHNPCEIFVDFNENTLDLWDVTDKSKPLMISSMPYPNSHYTHSGWWSEDKRFIFLHDELDEQNAGLNTTVRTIDISDLAAPVLSNVWSGNNRSIDHNGFTKGNDYYMSNYRRGLTVLDVSNPNSPVEKGFFDTFPSPSANSAQFNGAWGVFPFFQSGTLVVSDIEGGLFVLRETSGKAPPDLTEIYEYAVKLVCGIQKDPENGQLVKGSYGTVVNIGNVLDNAAKMTKTLALTIPPGEQQPGKTTQFGEDELRPMQALKTDCRDIRKKVFNGQFPNGFIEGFVIVKSNVQLEVTAVYSANSINEAAELTEGAGFDVEYVVPRLVKSPR